MEKDEAIEGLSGYEATVKLKDGSLLYLRAVCADDEEKLFNFFRGLSPKSVYLRFHRAVSETSREEVARFCSVDYEDSFALVGTVGEGKEERIIADGHFFRLPIRDAAEVSLVVDDAHQGKGVGAHLLDHLAIMAREKGIRFFESEVLAENKAIMRIFKNKGFDAVQGLEQGVYRVVLRIDPTTVVEETSAAREKVAAVARLRALLKPRSIAVIGASSKENSIGSRLLLNILYQKFNGLVYPVNPNSDVIASLKAYPTVYDVPGEVDLAVIAVPAEKVYEVVLQCGRKGVRGVVVISAGFGESGTEGMARQELLREIACGQGMLLIGPNCMGIMNTDPQVKMNATLSPVTPPPGNIALCCQGGTIGLAVLEYVHSQRIGLSAFINLGNRADISSNDLIEYWEEDPNTDVILLYVESFGNPRKFSRIASRIVATKPIAVVNSGRMMAGSRSAVTHDGKLVGAEVPSDCLFKQAGIIRVDTLKQLFDVADLLAHQPLPKGKRVAILSNGGGPAMLTAYACTTLGLELPALMDMTVAELKDFLPRYASLNNPIDMTADAAAGEYSRALKVLLDDDEIDSVIAIFIPPIFTDPEDVANAIREVAPLFRQRGKTLLASFTGLRDHHIDTGSGSTGDVPCYNFPEATAAALARAYEYSSWRKRPRGKAAEFEGIDREKANEILNSALEKSTARPLWLDWASVTELLDCYGINVAHSKVAANAKQAAQAAKEIGFPVAVKLLSVTIPRRAEFGGVVLEVNSQMEVEQAFIRIQERLASAGLEEEMQGVLVQKMIPGGVEVIVGVTQDPTFGPLIMFGAGGLYAELFKDIAFRIHPLSDFDARQMICSVNAYRLLEGWRDSEPSDTNALADLLLRVSAMVEDLPVVSELDLNPVKVLGQNKGYNVVDARIMLA